MLDCDAVYHEMLRTDPALRGAIEGAFGPVFGPDGTLDRQKLGNIVFSDPAALERLNAIVYEFLPPELMRRAADIRPAVRRLLPGALLPYPGKHLRRSGAVPGSGTDFLPENAPGNRTYLRRNQNHDRRNESQARKALLQPQKRL